ncbi:MAG: carboxypeptidase regulatory-like domain-containing protein [Pyrinomonadaceae bacterium]|nr:carboxypeptidase regulatory-like domain-containing protein [Pyrinomonadaceae bacterium]
MKRKALMLSAMLLGLALVTQAQTSRGTVSGVVSDAAGARISGATVTLTNTDTTVSRAATTNDEGFYRFDAVDLGPYSLAVSASGFGALTKTGVVVSANQTSVVDAQLEPGGQQVTVDVVSEAGAALQTEAPVRGGNISSTQVTELPFAGRNPVALALTLPGVTTNRGGFGVGTFSVNGARGRSNNFLIDGTENNDISVAGQGFQITNPDSVQEVSIQTSNYDSEFGRAGGAVVNTITKAGTNEFHGTASFFLDSTRDDAITSSLGRDPAILARGHLNSGTQTIYSGTLGGPLYLPRFGEGGRSVIDGRNRTFFFLAYQEDRRRSSASAQLTTATQAGRDRLRQLFPAGANANVDAYLAATAQAIGVASPFNIALGPTALTAGAHRGDIQFGTFFRNYAALDTIKQWSTRIDHKLGDNDQLSGRFLSSKEDAPQGGTAGFPGFDADFTSRLYNFQVAETHIFSSTVTNEVRLSYNRLDFGFPITDASGPAGTIPAVTIASISVLGVAATFPQGRIANNYQVQDTMTYIRGDHTFRFGGDYLRQISTQAAPYNARGSLTFGSGGAFTGATGGAASGTFTSLANFVDNFGGSNGTAARDFGSAVYFPSLHRIAVFGQDRWKVSEALTITYGLRYERFGTPFNTLRTPAYTGLFNINNSNITTGPYSQPNQVPPDNNNFAPSFGVAYSPAYSEGLLGGIFGERKSVIRAGYQIGYDSFFNNIASNAAVSSPNIISTTNTSTISSTNLRGLPNFTTQFPAVAAPLSPLSAQTLVDPRLVNPYYQRWSLGIQRELPFRLLLDMSYVGSKGTRLYINEDANPLVPPDLRITPTGYTGALSGRLDNAQGGRTIRTNGGSSIYHSGQLNVTRRLANNFTVTGSYTWAKNIDNASEVFVQGGVSTGTSTFAVPAVFGGDQLDRAISLFDRAHAASFTYVYELPYYREQRGFIGHLLGGFQISGVTIFESGVPFTVANGLESNGITGQDRPNHNPNGQRGVRAIPVVNAQGFITGYTNPDAGNAPIDPNTAEFIANPTYTFGLAGAVRRIGSLGRNTQRSPGTSNFDINIQKTTRISENVKIQFRTEFYNAFNHPQFTQGSVSPFTPAGGTVGSNLAVTAAGRFLNPDTPTSDGGGRTIRYQIKLLF